MKFFLLKYGKFSTALAFGMTSVAHTAPVELQYRVMAGKILLFDVAMVLDGTVDNPNNTFVAESRGVVSIGKTFVVKIHHAKDTLSGTFVSAKDDYFRYQYTYDNTTAIPTVKSLTYDSTKAKEEPWETRFPKDKWQGVSFMHALNALMWSPKNKNDASSCPTQFHEKPLQIFTLKSIQNAYTKPSSVPFESYQKTPERFIVPPAYACEFKVKTLMGSNKSEDYYERSRFWFADVSGIPMRIPVYAVAEGTFADSHAILKSIKIDGKQIHGEPLDLFKKTKRPDLWAVYKATQGNKYPNSVQYNPDAKQG